MPDIQDLPGRSEAFDKVPPRELISIAPRRFLIVALIVIAVVLGLSTIAGALFYNADDPRFRTVLFYRTFWLDSERNLPTFFNFSLIMLAAFLLIVLARLQFLTRSQWRYHWAVMAAIFFFLAFDEAAQVHETSIGYLQYLLGSSGIFFFAWIIPAMVFVAVFFLSYIGFLRALPVRVSAIMILGGVFYVGGAIGMEMVGGTIAEEGRLESFTYFLTVSIEEVLEMIGLSVFSTALLILLSDRDDTTLD